MKLLFSPLSILACLKDKRYKLKATCGSTILGLVAIESYIFILAFSNLGYRLSGLILS